MSLFPLDDFLTPQPDNRTIEETLRDALAHMLHAPHSPPTRLMSEQEFWLGVSAGVIQPEPGVKVVVIPSKTEAP
jgi:hypothetical protein